MKTKILVTLLVLFMGGAILVAQNKPVQDVKSLPAPKTEMQKGSVYYTCPMHADVKMDKPGKCPQCGMALEKTTMKTKDPISTKSDAIVAYTCTMHPEVNLDKPGKCPKCGMDLVVKKP